MSGGRCQGGAVSGSAVSRRSCVGAALSADDMHRYGQSPRPAIGRTASISGDLRYSPCLTSPARPASAAARRPLCEKPPRQHRAVLGRPASHAENIGRPSSCRRDSKPRLIQVPLPSRMFRGRSHGLLATEAEPISDNTTLRLHDKQSAALKLRRRSPNMVRETLITVSEHVMCPQWSQIIGSSHLAARELD